MKIYKVVQKLLVGDTQTGDLISLLSFLESRLKSTCVWHVARLRDEWIAWEWLVDLSCISGTLPLCTICNALYTTSDKESSREAVQ
jgi:hypothetical protein